MTDRRCELKFVEIFQVEFYKKTVFFTLMLIIPVSQNSKMKREKRVKQRNRERMRQRERVKERL